MMRQRGFGIVWAIVLVVVLAAMGAAALRFSSTQQTTSANDAVGAQVYFAAVSAAEWGAAQVVAGSAPPDTSACTAGWLFAATDVPGAPIWVTVECARAPTSNQFCDGGEAIVTYRIVATACSQTAVAGQCPRNDTTATQPGYLERQVVATARWTRASNDCL